MEVVAVGAVIVWVLVGNVLLRLPMDWVLFAYAIVGIIIGLLSSYISDVWEKRVPTRADAPWSQEQKELYSKSIQLDSIFHVLGIVFMFSYVVGILAWNIFRLKYLFKVNRKEK